MTDIDFDELDRAVTSALSASGAGSPDKVTRDSASPAVVLPSEDASTEVGTSPSSSISSHTVHARLMSSSAPSRTTLARKPVIAASSAEASSSVDETQAPAPETTAPDTKPKRTIPHRAGRFMDVVHPGNKIPTPAPSVERPVTPTVPPLVRSSTPNEIPQSGKSHNASLEVEINNLFVSEGHEPIVGGGVERIETASPEIASSTETSAPQVPTDREATTDAIAVELGQPLQDARPDSPFIAHAKVEKRPLGGLEPLETSTVDYNTVDASDLTPKIDDAPGAPVPEELASDLTAIESQETASLTESPLASNTHLKTQVAVASSQEVAGPTSITRQYKEQPRTASEDDEAGAIFDPQTYQPPIEHPAKKSSGWGWVVACILIIVLATIAGIVAWMEGILPVPL